MAMVSDFHFPTLSTDTLVALGLYGAIAGAYLLVFPAALLFYLKAQWHQVGSVQRTLLYGLVFLFFPGLLLLSPFVNFRPRPRPLNS